MFSAVGLALDFVGAIALILGIFGHARPLTVGYGRSPEDAAHDAAFGVVGAVLLGSGFVLQSFQYFGVSLDRSSEAIIVAWFVTTVSASLLAYLAYGGIYLAVFERRRGQDKWDLDIRVHRKRDGLRFWHQEYDEAPKD
jgi:hypothetical protein